MSKAFVFVDTETTGLSLRTDRIIELGMIRMEENQIVDSFQTLLNPEGYLPKEITSITGIESSMLENAPTFRSVADRVVDLLNDAVFVAHNSAFDYSFLKKELKEIGVPYISDQLCTVKLSRKLFPQARNHSLDHIISRFNFKIKNRHRAYDDAMILVKFFKQIEKEFDRERIEEAIKSVLKTKSLPVNLDQKVVKNLPESPGVYIFYATDGYPLYVGKSINIKDRVLSHFYNSRENSVEFKIAQQVTHIESRSTTGELGALLLESRLIKELKPLYNRKSRLTSSFVVLTENRNKDGYLTADFQMVSELKPNSLNKILGIFKSQKATKDYLSELAKKNNLCEKLLGISKSKYECFSYQLGVCKGACVKKEKMAIYNARFNLAFISTKLKIWPFNGRVVIKEENEFEDTQFHLFDKWCYLGSFHSEDEILENLDVVTYTFDRDIYQVLKNFIGKSSLNIKVIEYKYN